MVLAVMSVLGVTQSRLRFFQ